MEDKIKDKTKKASYIFTRETFGMTLLLFTAIVFLMLVTRQYVFADIGAAVCTFMYGTFGYGSFLVLALLAYLGEWLTFEKKIKISLRRAFAVALTVFMLFLLFHAVTTRNFTLEGYGKYIADCYKNAQNGIAGYTFGGVVSAIVVYPLAKLSFVAAYIILSLLTVACVYVTVLAFGGRNIFTIKRSRKATGANIVADNAALSEEAAVSTVPTEQPQSTAQPVQNNIYVHQPSVQTTASATVEQEDDKFSSKNLGRKILFENGEFAAESYRRNMIFNENSYFNRPSTTTASEADYLSSFSSGGAKSQKNNAAVPEASYTEAYSDEVLNQTVQSTPSSFVYGEQPATDLGGYSDGGIYPVQSSGQQPQIYGEYVRDNSTEEEQDYSADIYEPESSRNYSENTEAFEEPEPYQEPPYVPSARGLGTVGFTPSEQPSEPEQNYNQAIRSDLPAENISADNEDADSKVDRLFSLPSRRDRGTSSLGRASSNAELFDDDEMDGNAESEATVRRDSNVESNPRNALQSGNISPVSPVRRTENTEKPAATVPPAAQPVPAEEKPKHVWKKYVRPSLDLLDDYPETNNINTGEIEDNKRIIVETLDRFKIASEVSNVTIGPAITRYDVIIIDKTKINQSVKYRDAIAMELKKDNVNAYLNYSKGALSIEVPNNVRTTVGLKGMLASRSFLNSKQGSLTFGLGKNIEGEVVCPDITKMPHLLVAGTTGSGKSICLSALLVSLLYKYGPEELRLILVDPKQVEFISYDKLPHLMINEILYECDKAIKALNWAIKEMERRYTLFKDMTEAGQATKNLEEYNAHLPAGEEKLPKILIVLDEFGDLMLQAKKDIESRIIKLVQKARAAGIHLILATQRPSVDCITGLIKSNLPTRIGFKVNSFDDARCIFDIGGAEKLLGRGDLYFRSAENPDLTRIQGCFIDTHEVQRVTDFIKSHNETYFDQGLADFINTVEQEETTAPALGGGEGGEDEEFKIDDTHIKALKYCVTSNQASVSMIQRRFPVGYIKACKIIDWMEKMNYITPSEGSKPRKVLLSKDEFVQIYGEDIDD